MPPSRSRPRGAGLHRGLHAALILLLSTGLALPSHAQSSCASDGQPVPARLLERFIDADCASCWSPSSANTPPKETLTIDWITPGERGEDATLSAAATRDALARLGHLGQQPPAQDVTHSSQVQAPSSGLRVAHGLAFNDYIGTSIEYRLPRQRQSQAGPLTAWLLLVETLPAGSEGSPIVRNLVRNTLNLSWNMPDSLSKKEQLAFQEFRPMRIPSGAQPARLRVVGWVEDAQGRVIAAAQSQCATARP